MSFISGMMRSFARQDAYHEKLKEMELKMRPAPLRDEVKCVQCGYCCHRRTCCPTPSEVQPIADHLGIEVDVLINRYYTVDEKSGTYFLRTIQTDQRAWTGELLPAAQTFSVKPCIFLDTEAGYICRIYPVRPREARQNGDLCAFTKEAESFQAYTEWGEGEIYDLLPGFNPYAEDDD